MQYPLQRTSAFALRFELIGTQIGPVDATKDHRNLTYLFGVKAPCRCTVIEENIPSPAKASMERVGRLQNLLAT